MSLKTNYRPTFNASASIAVVRECLCVLEQFLRTSSTDKTSSKHTHTHMSLICFIIYTASEISGELLAALVKLIQIKLECV